MSSNFFVKFFKQLKCYIILNIEPIVSILKHGNKLPEAQVGVLFPKLFKLLHNRRDTVNVTHMWFPLFLLIDIL